jgi:NAD dependent epimerase/dehydratase
MAYTSPLADRLCVVTGAGGFIGSHLVEELLAAGARVRALVHYNALAAIGHLAALPDESLEGERLRIVHGDVLDSRCMEELVAGADVVFHLAALIGVPYSYTAPESYLNVNARGTLNVLEACRKARTRRIVHTSTSEVYGSARTVPMDEGHPLQAQSPYSASKIAADKFAEAYHCSFELPLTTVRPFNTFGPRQSLRAVLPTILAQALSPACEAIRIGSADPVRDFTFVGDTVRAFRMAAEAPVEAVAGRLYNLGTGVGISVNELAGAIQRVVGSSKPVVADAGRVRPERSEVSELVSDPGRIEREVGWRAETTLEEGIRRTAKWLRGHMPPERDLRRYVV